MKQFYISSCLQTIKKRISGIIEKIWFIESWLKQNKDLLKTSKSLFL